MKRNKVKQEMAKTVARGLDMVLTAQAHSGACSFFSQPKAPSQLSEFKRVKGTKKYNRC